jgi:hypothetical protein
VAQTTDDSWRRQVALGRTAIVIATPALWDRGEAIQGNVGRPRLLDRRVAIARRRRASFDALWLLTMTTIGVDVSKTISTPNAQGNSGSPNALIPTADALTRGPIPPGPFVLCHHRLSKFLGQNNRPGPGVVQRCH